MSEVGITVSAKLLSVDHKRRNKDRVREALAARLARQIVDCRGVKMKRVERDLDEGIGGQSAWEFEMSVTVLPLGQLETELRRAYLAGINGAEYPFEV